MIDTVAGGGIDDGVAATQSWVQPSSLLPASDGSLYFTQNHRIRRIRPDGILETIAGTSTSGFSPDGTLASQAQLWFPGNLVRDPAGNLVFSDHGNRIRRVGPDGIITTIAGNGLTPAANATSGPALTSPVAVTGPPGYPFPALAFDPRGNLYICDGLHVRVLSATGQISLVANLDRPYAVAVVADGTVYVADGSGIEKVDATGAVTLFALNGLVAGPITDGQNARFAYINPIESLNAGPTGDLYVTGYNSLTTVGAWRITPDGKIYSVSGISGLNILAIAQDGTIYFQYGAATYAVQGSQPARIVAGANHYSVPDGTPARHAYLSPLSIAVDSSDRLVFNQNGTPCSVRRVRADGTIETIAGTGRCASAATSGPALTTDIVGLYAVAGTADGAILMTAGSALYRLASGQLTVTQIPFARAVTADSKSNAYAMGSSAVYKITPAGQVSTFADFSKIAPDVFSSQLRAIAADPSDNILCYTPGSVYKVSPAGAVLSMSSANGVFFALAGPVGYENDGQSLFRTGANAGQIGTPGGYSGDGGPAQSAFYNSPSQLAADSKGNVYFVDQSYGAVRRLSGSLPSVPPTLAAGGVLDSAAYTGSMYAPGEIVTIFGQNLAWSTIAAQPVSSQFPSVLGSTRVQVQGQSATLLAVSPGQINAILPLGLTGFTFSLTVDVDGAKSAPLTLPLITAHPGLYTANASGSGPGAIVNQDGSVNSAQNPAPRGSIVSFYGTGGGALNPVPLAIDGYLNLSPPFGTVAGAATASIGGQNAPVSYAGGAPYLVVGAFQANVQIPTSIPAGAADAYVTIANTDSNHVSVFVK
jgi:uncharacterized protein (TIGR03437 family)